MYFCIGATVVPDPVIYYTSQCGCMYLWWVGYIYSWPHKTFEHIILGCQGETYRECGVWVGVLLMYDRDISKDRRRRMGWTRCLLLLNKWRICVRVRVWVCYSKWNLSPDLGVTKAKRRFLLLSFLVRSDSFRFVSCGRQHLPNRHSCHPAAIVGIVGGFSPLSAPFLTSRTLMHVYLSVPTHVQ